MKVLAIIATILVVVGGLNWGLWAAFKFDLVASLLGEYSAPARVVYALVALSALVVAARIPVMLKAAR